MKKPNPAIAMFAALLIGILAWWFLWPSVIIVVSAAGWHAEDFRMLSIVGYTGVFILINASIRGWLHKSSWGYTIPYILCSGLALASLASKGSYNAGLIINGCTLILTNLYGMWMVMSQPQPATKRPTLSGILGLIPYYAMGWCTMAMWPGKQLPDLMYTVSGIAASVVGILSMAAWNTGLNKNPKLLALGSCVAGILFIISNLGQFNPGSVMLNTALTLSAAAVLLKK